MLDFLFLAPYLGVFVLVLARVSGMLIGVPWLSGVGVPWTVRGLLAVALALVLTPTQSGVTVDLAQPVPDLMLMVAGELLVGAVIGLGVAMLLVGMQLTGQLVAQMAGLSAASMFDAEMEIEQPVLAQFMFLFGVTAFMVLGGHRAIVGGLLDSFSTVPSGEAQWNATMLDALLSLLGQGFTLGLRAAAPAVVSLLLVIAVLGMIARVLPQFSVLVQGSGVHALVAMGMLGVSLGGIGMALHDEVEPALELLLHSLTGG